VINFDSGLGTRKNTDKEKQRDAMSRTFAAFLAAIILAPTFVHASTPDRSCMTLLYNCHVAKRYIDNPDASYSTQQQVKAAACVGYLAGYMDGHDLYGEKRAFCPPRDEGTITAGQDALIFVHWADQHPEQLHTDRLTCVMLAFADAYPCPPQDKQTNVPHDR
jgi:hypothetical protein